MSKLEGLEDEMNATTDNAEKVTSLDEAKKKRRPFHFWDVDGESYKLKLTTAYVGKLENKYNANIMDLLISNGVPPLTVMLTVIQAAAAPFNRGVTKYADVQNLYDKWLDEGGNMMDLLQKVIIPTLAVSGFFTEIQAKSIMESLKDAEEEL